MGLESRSSEKIHIYMMPGLAASSSIFKHIQLPKETYEIHLLEWMLPEKKEPLEDYARRMCENIKHQDIVLIGMSFGGVLVQEMAAFASIRRLIIISSVKCRKELPRLMKTASTTGIFRLLPTGLMSHLDVLSNLPVGDYAKKRIELYKEYLSVNDTLYLDWAIENMVCWNREEPSEDVVHIHGDQDEIFPIKYIDDCIRVPGGTHVMILNRFRWFNQHLEEIIATGQLSAQEEMTQTRRASQDPEAIEEETSSGTGGHIIK